MKFDFYTKFILTIIALVLTLNLTTPLIETAQANNVAKFEHIESFGGGEFFDKRTGDIWIYSLATGSVDFHSRLVELGQPLQKQ